MRPISKDTRLPGMRSDGLTLDDVRGLIRKSVSYWAIDESGNPSRKPKEDGKAFTLSAVTELSPIDYDRLLEGVPLYDGEVHFSKLRNEHPDICIRLITNFGRENILIVSKTVTKKGKSVLRTKRRGPPTDELYLMALLNELIEAISEIDLSDSVIVTYDRNDNIREGECRLFWSDRRIVVFGDSKEYRLIQMADLASSSIGKMFLPDGFADPRYFERIMTKTVNLRDDLNERQSTKISSIEEERENGDRPQHNLALLPSDNRSLKYLTDSEQSLNKSNDRKKSPTVSNNRKNSRTENRDIPQYRPALLQYEGTNPDYLKESYGSRRCAPWS